VQNSCPAAITSTPGSALCDIVICSDVTCAGIATVFAAIKKVVAEYLFLDLSKWWKIFRACVFRASDRL